MMQVQFHPAALKVIQKFSQPVRRVVGQSLWRLQQGEVLSMPLSRHLKTVAPGVQELRVLSDNRAYRVFYVEKVANNIFVFHAFVKKTQKTPKKELVTARKRLKEVCDEKN